MAVLSKIRDRSLFLILIIGMALFAFVASPKDIISFFKSDKTNSVGSVNGENISREEFVTQVKAYQSGQANMNDTQAANAVWNNLMSEKIYQTQLENAGIVVGEKDIWEALINDPSLTKSPQFLNEDGLFDEENLKSYIADLEADNSDNGKARWASWLAYERQIKQNLERGAYLNLVKSGLGVSKDNGKQDYFLNNTKVNGKYVFLPFSSIPDSTINVSENDVKKYINNHQNDYQVKASRNIQYVVFDLGASDADKKEIKESLKNLINDRTEYSKVNKSEVTIKGFKNASDYETYLSENSDTPYSDNVVYKNSINKEIVDTLFALKAGDIYGPYTENNFLKLTKIVEQKEVPSVKASHILIAYEGAMRANPDVKRTKDEAEEEAKKVLRKVKRTSIDFAEEAKVSSDGPSGSRGGDLGWFKEGQMTPKFNDWVFSHSKNQIGLVETEFGFHIIKMVDAKTETGLKLATVSKQILPSEKTENQVFVEAESFAAAISKGQNFSELAKEKNYVIKVGEKIRKKDEGIPGLIGNNRSIVYWAFEDNLEIASIKRFDVDKAYVVAQLTKKEEKGLQTAKSAFKLVKPLVINDKKFEILSKRLQDDTLSDIADREKSTIRSTGEISFDAPVRSALGKDKSIIGALLGMKEGDIVRGIRGTNGVYILQLNKKTNPVELDSYEPYRLRLENKINKNETQIYEALKKASNVEDYRQ